jgi:hypothetical protein
LWFLKWQDCLVLTQKRGADSLAPIDRHQTARNPERAPAGFLESCRGYPRSTHDAEKCSRCFGLEKLKGGRQGFLHIPAPARMFDSQRALWRRFMRSEHGRREDCATRASRTRETSNGDVRVAQSAAMLRGVGQVTEQLKIGAALKKIIRALEVLTGKRRAKITLSVGSRRPARGCDTATAKEQSVALAIDGAVRTESLVASVQ